MFTFTPPELYKVIKVVCSKLQDVVCLAPEHSRRIYPVQKRRSSAVWGTSFIQFLAELAAVHQDEMKKRMS